MTYRYQYLNHISNRASLSCTIPRLAKRKDSLVIFEAQKKAKSIRWTLCRIVLVGGSIAIAVLGMGLALILYICVGHTCGISDSHLTSTAPLGRVLTISEVASHIAPVTIPLLMGLTSYNFAEKWMKESLTEGSNRPSPMQLGMLLIIFNSANIPTFIFALLYFLGFGRTKEQKALPAPLILRRSAGLLFLYLLTGYLIAGSDAWLHVTSKATIMVSKGLTADDSGSALLNELPVGRAVDETACDEARSAFIGAPLAPYGLSCGQLNGERKGRGAFIAPGLRTLSNSSNDHQIAFADDQTAIVVPVSISPNITYRAQTVGIKSSCTSITKSCLSPNISSEYGSDIHCTNEIAFNANSTFKLAALDDAGNAVEGYNVSSNPFRAGSVVTSMAYYDEGHYISEQFGYTGWIINGKQGAINIIYCNVSVLDVTYHYNPPSSLFTIVESALTLSSLQNTRAVVTYQFNQAGFIADPVAAVVDGVDPEYYEESYALELSRQTLARGAVLYIAQNVTVDRYEQVLGTKLHIIPFTIMLGTMVLYGCLVLTALLQAVISVSRTSYVQLASAHLTDPLTSIHVLYGPKDTLNTWKEKVHEKFGTEADEDRLNVGEFYDHYGGRRFSVQKSQDSYYDSVSSIGE